jgi:hypothetical protein
LEPATGGNRFRRGPPSVRHTDSMELTASPRDVLRLRLMRHGLGTDTGNAALRRRSR